MKMPKSKMGVFLMLAASAGMIVTIVMTAKKAPEAQKAKEDALALKRQSTGDENAQLTTIESIKAQLPCYAPVIFTAAMATGSMIASQVVPQGALDGLEKTFRTYKDISAKMHGPEAENIIDQMTTQKLTQGTDGMTKETFVIHFNDKDILFETTLLDVLESEYDVNRFFKGTGTITFNQMLQLFHQEEQEFGDEFGWDECLGDAWYGYSWIDFRHRRGMLNGKPVTFIEMPFECHPLDEERAWEDVQDYIKDQEDYADVVMECHVPRAKNIS